MLAWFTMDMSSSTVRIVWHIDSMKRFSPCRQFIHSFTAKVFPKVSHIHNVIQYLETKNAEVVQLINAFPFNNYVINETLQQNMTTL